MKGIYSLTRLKSAMLFELLRRKQFSNSDWSALSHERVNSSKRVISTICCSFGTVTIF